MHAYSQAGLVLKYMHTRKPDYHTCCNLSGMHFFVPFSYSFFLTDYHTWIQFVQYAYLFPSQKFYLTPRCILRTPEGFRKYNNMMSILSTFFSLGLTHSQYRNRSPEVHYAELTSYVYIFKTNRSY